jgi:hypothetical protein
MIHPIVNITGPFDRFFVFRGRCLTWLALWCSGHADHGGGGWS